LSPSPSPEPANPEVAWLKAHLGKPVDFKLVDGSLITGTLVGSAKYTFVASCDGRNVLIFKHGLTCVSASDEP
jgi:hypothetical protein